MHDHAIRTSANGYGHSVFRGWHAGPRAGQAFSVALLDSGSEGLVVAGTTGESPTLSNEEKLALIEAVAQVAHTRGKPVIAGTTTYNTAESIEMSREAEHRGADGILGTVPYYNNPPQEGLYQHFRAIASAVDLPVLLYNIPARSPRNMEASTTLRLARDVPNIIGVKEASANFKQIGEIIRDAPPGSACGAATTATSCPCLRLARGASCRWSRTWSDVRWPS